MHDVIIYQPAKTAMQSGRANMRRWLVEFQPEAPKRADPLMGWIGSSDTQAQIRLSFDSRDEAVTYAKKHGLSYQVHEPRQRRVRPKNYSENFAFDRLR